MTKFNETCLVIRYFFLPQAWSWHRLWQGKPNRLPSSISLRRRSNWHSEGTSEMQLKRYKCFLSRWFFFSHRGPHFAGKNAVSSKLFNSMAQKLFFAMEFSANAAAVNDAISWFSWMCLLFRRCSIFCRITYHLASVGININIRHSVFILMAYSGVSLILQLNIMSNPSKLHL